jgi:hypothetical protein
LTAEQAEILVLGFILVWFGVETIWDVRKSVMLPVWLVLPPVVVGAAFQLFFGVWYVAAAVAVAMILHLSDRLVLRIAGTGLLLAASAAAGNWALAAGLVLFWALWEANVAGGADALAAYAALLAAPQWEMLGCLLAGIFLWAVGTMLLVYRREFIERWKRLAWRIVLRSLPTESELTAEGKPTLGGLWIGAALFAAWRFIV